MNSGCIWQPNIALKGTLRALSSMLSDCFRNYCRHTLKFLNVAKWPTVLFGRQTDAIDPSETSILFRLIPTKQTFMQQKQKPSNVLRCGINFFDWRLKLVRNILLALLLTSFIPAAGCSIQRHSLQEPELSLPKPNNAHVLILGDVKSDRPGWQSLQPVFRRKFVEYLSEQRVFESVIDNAKPSGDTLILIGNITEVDEGNRAARAVIGFGAGKAKLKGKFELQDTIGGTLLRFESYSAHYGGVGLLLGVSGVIGGAQGGVETLIKSFAISVAQNVMRWAGKKSSPFSIQFGE